MANGIKEIDGDANSRELEAWSRVYDPHFDTQLAWGRIAGAFPISYGSSIDGVVSGDGEVALREGAELAYGADLSADTIYIVSSSASDTQTYSIQGIDTTGAYATTTVVATGTTPAALSGTWNHIQRCICTDGVDNVGYVYTSTKSGAGVPATTGDQIQTVMAPGDNYAINPMIVVPNEQIFTFNDFDFSQDVKQSARIKVYANRQGRWLINFKFYVGNEDQFTQTFHTPLRLYAGDRMRVTIEELGAGASAATFGMNGNVLTKNNGVGIGKIFE